MTSLKIKINQLLRPAPGEHKADKNLIWAVGFILCFGLVILSAASSVLSYVRFGSSYYYFNHQLIGLVIGLVAFFFFSRLDYHHLGRMALWFLGFSVFLLVLVFIPGLAADYGSSRSWINLFGFSLQPSELVKISFLIYLAAWLEARKKHLHEFHGGIAPFAIVLGLIGFLMILQPDLGTLSIISAVSLIVYFVAGGRTSHVLAIIILGVIFLVIMVNINEYQATRFKCMSDPSFSSNDKCYQLNQSLIAVGSGGLWGRGIGESRQKFMYLPEVIGDSIFAVIGEEIGWIFSVVLVGAYLYIFYRGYLIAKAAPDVFGQILAIGIVSWITLQAMINIGGMIALIPMTGVPLPLVSSGGSAILSSLIAIGILVNISKQTRS